MANVLFLAQAPTLAGSCSLSTSSLNFGNYDPIIVNRTSPLDITGSVTVNCTSGTPITITLGQGTYSASGSTDVVPQRQMSDGFGHYLSYNLYSDPGRTTIWNNTTGVSATGTGNADTYTIYGRIDGGQSSAYAGSYSDTVTATINY